MKHGICHLSLVPLRAEAADSSEMVNQLLYGEHFEILEKNKKWSRIRLAFDGYEGWIDNKQFSEINETTFADYVSLPQQLSSELVDFVSTPETGLMPICLGSSVNAAAHFNHHFEGGSLSGQRKKDELIETALLYLNAPYLWGGKSPFGIDCSGLTQMVYKLNGQRLLRDAKQQATQGQVLSFIEESEAGDLAFFDNDEGQIIHVGIIMNENRIVHAHGKVRIDRIDHCGIFNADLRRHTHKLRVIKRIIT